MNRNIWRLKTSGYRLANFLEILCDIYTASSYCILTMLNELLEFLERATHQNRLNASHVSMCAALWTIKASQHGQHAFSISRRKVMQLACIRSSGTYHKNIRDLQAWGLITYIPSYHPAHGSTVSLILKN